MNKQKTILNFFTKSPATKSPSSENQTSSKTRQPAKSPESHNGRNSKGKILKTPVRENKVSASIVKDTTSTPKLSSVRDNIDFDDEETVDLSSKISEDSNKDKLPSKKRRRIVLPSESDSDSDYAPKEDKDIYEASTDEFSVSDGSETESPKRKKKTIGKTDLSSFKSPRQGPSYIAKAGPSSKSSIGASPKLTVPKGKETNGTLKVKDSNNETKWYHEKLCFLKRYLKEDGTLVDVVPSTINDDKLPNNFFKTVTPAMKQWWRIKLDHFDTIIFFKVGKFYELYHMDAVVGVKELGLIFMKGDVAHSGFPEISYGRYSECLVEKGYTVARVEQTETPQMAEERCKKGIDGKGFIVSKPDKVVEREICQITTKGTRTLTYQEENIGSNNNYLLAVCEKDQDRNVNAPEYGICFIDTSIGKFTLGQFVDDRHGSRLLTLIALYPPVEVIYCDSTITKKSLQLLSRNLTGTQIKPTTFEDPTSVLKHLQISNIFTVGDEVSDTTVFPDALSKMLDKNDQYQTTALKEYQLAVQALGGCFKYLEKCCIDDLLLSLNLMEEYIPFDKVPTESERFKRNMVLDGATLQNLDIVRLPPSADSEGTLFGTLDNCSTSFGKRLLRAWMCSPLCDTDLIQERLDGVDDLSEVMELVEAYSLLLKKLPDLERLLSKIHAYGLKRESYRPDARAIFYEADIYNKKKINDFMSALDGFKVASQVAKKFERHIESFNSALLKKVMTVGEPGLFPDMEKSLSYFADAFDHQIALKKGTILPSHGVDSEYDTAVEDIDLATRELNNFLEEQQKHFGSKVKYVGTGKSRYLIEVPEHKNVPSDFEFQGGRKGFKRYSSKKTKDLVARLTVAEERRAAALKDVSRRIFERFDSDYKMWATAVNCLATLDVLTSLCIYSESSEVPMCRPLFIHTRELTSGEPFLEIHNGRHPTFLKYFTGNNYIPNNVYVGPHRSETYENKNTGGRLVLVTGPNMGGKSTLMRQAGTLVIMAHMGSRVPADVMRLTPVDRIFTRVGAGDQISKGESTFYVETSETASILRHATKDSFVLVDELGRGTATYDGIAIAYAALRYLVEDVKCRTLFSTHYHSLVEDFGSHPDVGLGHMACMVEKNDYCPALAQITFLYNFINGACPKSYGFSVAMHAGIPCDMIEQGFFKAQELEFCTRFSKTLKYLLSVKTPEEIIQEITKKNVL